VQLVALNFQHIERPIRLNFALFNVGGRCGYVKKPASRLRTEAESRALGDRLGLEASSLTIEVHQSLIYASAYFGPQGWFAF